MTKKLQLYKCELCKNMVEVVLEGDGELVCCGQPMTLLKANSVDATKEKHVPFFVKKDGELEIIIGSEKHPMEEKHYIQFIEVHSKDGRYVKRKYLYPGEDPSLLLKGYDLGSIKALEHCNIHGLWEANYD